LCSWHMAKVWCLTGVTASKTRLAAAHCSSSTTFCTSVLPLTTIFCRTLYWCLMTQDY
jgi:hypothetical protein